MPQGTTNANFNVLEDEGDGEIEIVETLNNGKTSKAKELARLAREEAFMNELVLIEVYESPKEDDPTHFILNVNGTNQVVFRGRTMHIKRKYLEVLARMRETRFSQPQRDLSNPEAGNDFRPRSGDVYPYTLVEDTREGLEWHKKVRSSAAANQMV